MYVNFHSQRGQQRSHMTLAKGEEEKRGMEEEGGVEGPAGAPGRLITWDKTARGLLRPAWRQKAGGPWKTQCVEEGNETYKHMQWVAR